MGKAMPVDPSLQAVGCYRQSARNVVLDKAQRLRQEAAELEALAKMIPEREEDMPPGAGEAIWKLVMHYAR